MTVQAGGAGTDALTTAEPSCAYLHTLLKGRPQTACHRAEALAHPGKPAPGNTSDGGGRL